MTTIILNGCNGHMGRVITNVISTREDMKIIAGIDISPEQSSDYPVYTSISDFKGEADVLVDFSHPSALESLLSYIAVHHTAAVIATTGLSKEQIEKIKIISKKVPVFFSANMSMGVNLIAELAKKASEILWKDFDIEIIEAHHNQKIDAPSGTALMLANAVSDACGDDKVFDYDRHSRRKKREKKEIGIHSIRGGTIVGEHSIMFAGLDEVITISHSARSKDIFAVGAVNAAAFLKGKPAGMYSMSDIIG